MSYQILFRYLCCCEDEIQSLIFKLKEYKQELNGILIFPEMKQQTLVTTGKFIEPFKVLSIILFEAAVSQSGFPVTSDPKR